MSEGCLACINEKNIAMQTGCDPENIVCPACRVEDLEKILAAKEAELARAIELLRRAMLRKGPGEEGDKFDEEVFGFLLGKPILAAEKEKKS